MLTGECGDWRFRSHCGQFAGNLEQVAKTYILFIICTADLAPIVADHGLSLHQYADDSQIYGSCPPAATPSLSTDISLTVDNVSYLTGCDLVVSSLTLEKLR